MEVKTVSKNTTIRDRKNKKKLLIGYRHFTVASSALKVAFFIIALLGFEKI